MKFSIVPLLLSGETISGEARDALRQGRLKDAARLLMRDYGLTCAEAGDLLAIEYCD